MILTLPHGIVLVRLFCLGIYISAADRSKVGHHLYLEVSPEGHQLAASDHQLKDSFVRKVRKSLAHQKISLPETGITPAPVQTEVHLKDRTEVRIVEVSGATGRARKEDLTSEHMDVKSVELLPEGDRAQKEEQQHQPHGHVMSTGAKVVWSLRELEAPGEDRRTVADLRVENRLDVAPIGIGPLGTPTKSLTSDVDNRLKSSRGAFSMVELFPAQLQGKDGMVDTATALTGKKYVMIYFSASWCPMCRVFTPKLADMYKRGAVEKQIEVIFVSGDQVEAGFQDYYKEMPWLAVPFSDHGKIEELSKTFRVSGIPTVIVLNSKGYLEAVDLGQAKCLEYFGGGGDGRSIQKVLTPDIDNRVKSSSGLFSLAYLFPAQLQGKDGMVDTATALTGKKYVMIYFSAHRCSSCCAFTPKLADMYKRGAVEKQIEVIFVSDDQDEAGFQDSFKDMPWLAVPFSDPGKFYIEKLGERFGVLRIPTLLVIAVDLETTEGRLETAEGQAKCLEYFGDGGAARSIQKVLTSDIDNRLESLILELFPAQLQGKDGMVDTATALTGKKYVMIYFCAARFETCRAFTPKLADMYNEGAVEKQIEVIYVSDDKDEASFHSSFKEMPWLAVPFENDRDKFLVHFGKLLRRFDVSDIHTLIVLNSKGDVEARAEGQLKLAEGQAKCLEYFGDGGAARNIQKVLTSDIDNRLKSSRGAFSMAELFPAQLQGKDGMVDTATALTGKKYVMIYFSASWSGTCRAFTPKLADMYKKGAVEKQIEVIFVSGDEDEAGFQDSFKEMPWLAVPFSDRGKPYIEELTKTFGVRKFPALIVLNSNGDLEETAESELETAEGQAKFLEYFGGGGEGFQCTGC